MSKYTSEQYNKVFWKLPVEIRDMITSYSTTEHITIIGKKHNLHIDKIGELVDLTFDVMMGIVATKDFVAELQNTLQITALEASVLARDIDENIFKPIKETMTHLYAGRAPFKPSSSLVEYYDEEEDHPALDKNTLLKEIEDPEPVKIKKEIVQTTQKTPTPSTQPVVNKIPNPADTSHTEVTEYHEEISNTPQPNIHTEPVKPVEMPHLSINNAPQIQKQPEPTITQAPIQSQNIDEKASSILNQIASIKLSQVFVMPKGPSGIAELGKMESEQIQKPKIPVSQPQASNPTVEKPTLAEQTPTQPEKRIDPYREPI